MILEQRSGEEIKKLTGRDIIWSPNDLGIPYLGLYEEHGKIGEIDYLRFGVRYIGNNTLNLNSNERIIIGEIHGELLSLDSLIFRSREYCYTELRSSLNWVWRYNGIVIDTRNITGILGFIQKTWKESDESNCQLEVIDGRLCVVTIPNVCIYPGDELVLSVKNNMDLLLPTIGDELMKIRTSNKAEGIFDIMNFKDSPKSYDLTTSPISTANTTTQNIGGILDGFESPASHNLNQNNDLRKILIPYSLNCTNEYYCSLCNRNHSDSTLDGYGEFEFSAKIYRNALVFMLGEKDNMLNLTESQINYFDHLKSTSCEKEVYTLKSAHKINFRSKKGISIDTISEINENDQVKNVPIEILLVKNYLTRSTSEMLICEFQILRNDNNTTYDELGKKCYVSQSILFYCFFDKWMSEKIIDEYKYIRIPVPLMIEQHRQMLLPYPEGIYWNLDTLSWRYQTQTNNSRHIKYDVNDNTSLETSVNDHIAREQEFVGVSLSYENDPFELFKSYITICSIKYKNIYNSKYKENNGTPITPKTVKNWDPSGSSVNSYKKKKIRTDIEEYKYSECDNNCYYESNNREFFNKVGNGNSNICSSEIHDIIENCNEINNIDVINNKNKHILSVITEDINIISQQVEILLTPPYSSFIKFCMKRLGFSITYNKRRAWFSVKTRGVLEAFNLAIKWIKKQKNLNEEGNYSPINSNDNTINGNIHINSNITLPAGKNIQSENHNKKNFQKLGSIANNINYVLNKNDISAKSDMDSDVDSVYSFNEQANRLKPLPKRIIWVPSRRVFIVSYKRLGTLNQMNTKSFNPTIYGGVKKALKHACIFQSQTENCKYSGSETSSRDNPKGIMGSKLINDSEENNNIDTSLKPLNHWVKNIDPKVSPETVTSAYREAVSTYLTHSTTYSNQNITIQEDKNRIYNRNDREDTFQGQLNDEDDNLSTNQIPEDGMINNVNYSESGRLGNILNTKLMNVDIYINNLNSDYLINDESNSINSSVSPIDCDFGDKPCENNDLFEYKPFKMYHDQVFLNKDSVYSLMNIDESINNQCLNNRILNDSIDGQTVILDEDMNISNNGGGVLDSTNVLGTDYLSSFEGYKITEPLVSISDPYSNIFELDGLPVLHDQLVRIESPYGYIDSFTLIEP
ncbi:adenosine monophosphate deaminase [Cryptosporidium xiaoi]|uniref:Adenosine monophosphate deaminase n=1 Tax=Cryptosporidium xiaoi TaxID=659607 RepID=A0AAV9XYM2_9CRYT